MKYGNRYDKLLIGANTKQGVNMAVEELKVEETFNYVLELYIREISANNKFAFQIMTNTVCTETKNSLKGTIKHFKNNWESSELYFIPSSLSFTNARMNELAQFMNANMFNIFLIKQFLSDIQSLSQNEENGVPLFDYVFFDCPPTTNILTQSVFLASDYYIIPTIFDEISTKGVPDYITEIEKTRNKFSLHEELRGVLIEKAFPIKPRLVGVFETLYKNRAGITLNYELIASLDRNMRSFESILSEARFAAYRYNTPTLTTRHVFNETIYHKDARASGESVAKNTANALLTDEYQNLASILMTMI